MNLSDDEVLDFLRLVIQGRLPEDYGSDRVALDRLAQRAEELMSEHYACIGEHLQEGGRLR